MPYSVAEVKEKITPILKAAGVTRSSLFGSIVRGEAARGSDVDILVEVPHDKTLLDLVDLKLRLEDALQQPVDVVEYSAIKPRLRDRILNEQLPIL